MIHLYDRETSGNAYKVRLLLAFLGLPYSRIAVPLKSGRNEVASDYFKLNPRGQIPTLVDGPVTLWGSTASLCYLASKYDPSRSWLPTEPSRFAEVMQWLELAQNEIQTGLFLARAITRFGYAGDLNEARSRAVVALQTLESRLSAHEWLVGAGPTLADIACFPYTALAHEGNVDTTSCAGVEAWLKAIRSLEGFVGMPGL